MEVNVKSIAEKSQVELSVTATPEEFRPFIEKAVRSISRERPVKGFRPGKVSVPVALEAYGTERVVSAAVERAVPRFFVQAVLEKDIEALGRPATSVERADLKEGLSFTATVDVLPAVKVAQPSDLQVDHRSVEVTEEDVQRELDYLARQRSTFLDIARPAQKGDTVTVDFEVSMAGTAMAGGSSKNHPVHLGEGRFIPDFEQKLEGIQAGEAREFSMTFPADFPTKDLAGKEAQAKVKAHTVQKRVVPTIDDAFAKSVGHFKDLADLKTKLRENIVRDRTQREHERVQSELAEKLADQSEVGVLPVSLVEREIDRRLQELMQFLAYQGKNLDEYLKEKQQDVAGLREEFRGWAEKTARVSLVLRQFAKDQKIAVSDEEVEREIERFLSQFKNSEEATTKVDQEELRSSVVASLRNQKALELLEITADTKRI